MTTTTTTFTVTSQPGPLPPHPRPPLPHRRPLLPHHRYHPSHHRPPQPTGRDLADEFLSLHNTARRDANLPPLVWDTKLEQYAKQYAVQRGNTDCAELIHSHGPYGENIFWGGGPEWRPKDAVEQWMHEEKFYDPDANDCKDGQMCGHYTQIVWRDSCRLGCALQRCKNNDTFVVCSYDPPGNYVGEKPFLHYDN
ncbi:hypothetical protein DCAR_0207878 [Daucus carota subsp. sativus]|uniref:SCP domain-containing protein n=1 Tax=Daucus carota subsp. sativus TaxID=79200 RepID=A0AAF0WI31_DAUCS|nr:hypothetical protein DCAR_0207878 [Daucus carota subsp. sativus]